MIKRVNKITALAVAVASIMSVVPAMASERLGTKDGTLNQAIAFQNGEYAYYGYKSDDSDTGIYYNAGSGSSDSFNSDLQEYNFGNASKYGDKYAYAKNDSNDEYLIDLTNGKAVDDQTAEDKQDNARTKLQSLLKKTDRYANLKDSDGRLTIDSSDFKQVLTGQFGDVWYQYTTSAEAIFDTSFVAKDNTNVTTAQAVVFIDNNGNYIDASYLANMQIFSSKENRAVKIENYDKKNNDAALAVHLENIKVIAQDKDYLYTLTTVTVADTSGLAYTSPETQYFIQKISKAVGDKKDGSYLPKSVASYQLDNNVVYNDDDAANAYKVIFNTNGENLDGYNADDNLYSVINGTLYVTSVKSDKVKVYTLQLKKVKDDALNSSGSVIAHDVDTYLVKKSDGNDHDTTSVTLQAKADNDVTGSNIELNSAVSVDSEGYTWILDKGTIYKYVDGSFKEMYTCDRAFDSLDVYSEGSLVAWDSTGGAYTTVQEGKQTTADDAAQVDPNLGQATTTTTTSVGWKQLTDGTWNFYDATGTKAISKWISDNGTWYYLKSDGVMATGWINDNGTWYYLASSGAMKTGWINDNGTWYYLASSGAMRTGWVNDNGTWYYLNSSGAMLANTTVDGYALDASGAWIN